MPVSFGLWRLDGGVRQVPPSVIESEDRLEEILEARPDILGSGDLLRIGRQVITDYGKRIDLLAMDAQGDLHVIELKKYRTPRDVVAQALEYGFWAQGLSFDAIRDLYGKHNEDADFDSAFTNHFETEVPDTINSAHHLVIVAAAMDTSTAQIVEYVRGYGVPINVLFFQYLRDDDREYLARSWLSNPDLESPTGGFGAKKQAAWNGQDFYVAVGESRHRNWDDMRRYGFVSAGHGAKYRKAMLNLFEGARVWAAIPSIGYVGVGEVESTAVPVTDFDSKWTARPYRYSRHRYIQRASVRTPTIPHWPNTSFECGGSTPDRAIGRCGKRGCTPTRTWSPNCATPTLCNNSPEHSTSTHEHGTSQEQMRSDRGTNGTSVFVGGDAKKGWEGFRVRYPQTAKRVGMLGNRSTADRAYISRWPIQI